MHILVINTGSSSLKFGMFLVGKNTEELFRGSFERFRQGHCDYRFRQGEKDERGAMECADIAASMLILPSIFNRFGLPEPAAIGHRIAHGGDSFPAPALLDEPTIAEIEKLTPLAPQHNPANLLAVRLCKQTWPDLPQIAVFDTSFHLTNPAFATTYAVPSSWREAGLRRYGFHGTSHKYVAARAARELGFSLRDLKVVSVHLGNGASACAVNYGESVDSSMGMTPLEGLVMGTRSGDVDPGAFGFLSRQFGLPSAEVEAILYNESGLKGLAGSSDMRDLEDRAKTGDADAQLAIEIYAYRVRKYIGAYAAAMGGIDAIVFTGGIGENSPSMRRRICDGLEFMGLRLDHDRNQTVDLSGYAAPQVQAYGSRVRVLVTETAEQLMIANETSHLLRRTTHMRSTIPISVSARHVHLSQEAIATLFGQDYQLSPLQPLRQPGHWLVKERVILEGPKGRIEHVAILGPARARTQIEVSRTDSFTLGINVPTRESGKLDGTPSVTIIGPGGRVTTDGLIVAARHIHTNADDAKQLGLEDGDFVDVSIGGSQRALVFARTLVRVTSDAVTEMHIDADEANAAGIAGFTEGSIVEERATIA